MSSEIPKLNDADLTRLINVRSHVLVKFSAPWCQPCKALAPIFEQAAGRHIELAFAEVNVEDQPAIGARLGVRALPTLQGWRDGNLVFSKPGMVSPAELDKMIAELVET
jgi:thioredoxin 1